MTHIVAALGWTIFGLAILAGLALDLVGLFGNWIILGAVAAAWAATRFAHFSGWCLALLLVLAAAGEVIEFVTAGMGAVKFGGSKRSAWAVLAGCIVGAAVGTPLLPIIGTLAGACIGAFLGALGYETLIMQRPLAPAAAAGLGAALGKAFGLAAKFLIGLVMLLAAALSF